MKPRSTHVFNDRYRLGSTFSAPLLLSSSSAEWDAFETNFGEVSLLNALNQAMTGGTAADIVVTDTADVSCWVALFESATGTLVIHTDSALTYNASTGALSTTRMGVGSTAAPTDILNATASATLGTAVVGPTELLTNGTFDSDLSGWTAGANWAWGAGGTADHSAGSTATLTQTIATTSGQHYQVTVVLSAVSASNVVMTLTSSSGSESFVLSAATTYTYSFKAGAASSTLTFTPNTAFVGSITSVSFKLITPASVYTFATMDSGGARSGLCSVATDDALYNCFVGLGSGVLNTTGYNNSAIGTGALAANTTGGYNSAMGRSALAANTTGIYNSAMGASALTANTTGGYNSAIGTGALAANTTGNNNSAIGTGALAANTTGYNNSAIGTGALAANTTGGYNSAIGTGALAANTTGGENSAMGRSAGLYYGSGTDSLTSATQCVYLGASSRANANTMTNEIVIGYNAIGAGSNTATLGNTSIVKTQLRGNFGTLVTYGTSAAGVLGIASGTAPTTSPADAVQMWSADFNAAAGKSALHLRDESGILSVFGNNWGLFTAGAEVIDGTAEKCIFLSNGTAPSAHTDNGIYIHSADSGDATATLALYLEQAVEAGAPTPDNKIKVRINGVEYWIGLDAV